MDIAALVISGISLVLAVISFVISVKSQNLQNKVNEIELKLKKYELDEKVLSGEISPSMARAELDALFDFVKCESNLQKEKTLIAKSKLKKRGSL